MFRKYPEIENYDRSVTLNYWLRIYPELREIEYIVQEKIHGTNLQFVFSPGKPHQIASREKILTKDDDFFGIHQVLAEPTYMKVMMRLQEYANMHGGFNIFGEFHGPGIIHKGVKYGVNKNIAFFDAWMDDD